MGDPLLLLRAALAYTALGGYRGVFLGLAALLGGAIAVAQKAGLPGRLREGEAWR